MSTNEDKLSIDEKIEQTRRLVQESRQRAADAENALVLLEAEKARIQANGNEAERGKKTNRLLPRLTVSEVAERLRVSETSVGRFVASGDLVSIRLGRRVLIDEEDLADFIARHKKGGR